jgi:DNA polymerase-3 subunit gamma/tau
MAYLVLARKYRSSTFDEVVGQEPIARTLTNAIEAGRIAQAYLFTGTRGVGKTTMARILAKALNCLSSEGPTAKPCGKCDACISIARGDDLDVIEIDGATNRGIEQMQELRAGVSLHPARSRYKIYYIDEVHQITRDAFNALLKTLEEPPAHVKFIFATTEPEKIPATILSRCQRFDFRNIPTRLIAGHLKALCVAEKMPAEEDALFRLARAAAGSMRDGVSLLDQVLAASQKVTDEEVIRVLGVTPEERVMAIVRAIAEGQSATALAEVAAVLDGGVGPAPIAVALCDYFRNMMIARTCGAQSELIELPDSQRQTMAELAQKFSVPTIVQAVGILQRLSFSVRASSLARALVEAAVVRLAESDKFVDPQSLLDRLEGGGGPGPAARTAPGAAARPGQAPPRGPASSAPAARPGAGFSPAVAPARATASPATSPAAKPSPSAPAAPGAAGAAPSQAAKPAAEPAPRKPKSAAQLKGLSTAEKEEIQKDPAVRAATNLFGGDVVDMRKEAPPEGDDSGSDGHH